jgi:hypothetical protein
MEDVHLMDTHVGQAAGGCRLLDGVEHGDRLAVRERDDQVRPGSDVVEHVVRTAGHRELAHVPEPRGRGAVNRRGR